MAAGYIHKGPNVRSVRHSNEDLTKNISHSVFVTNFPKSVTSRVLWEKCQVYGTVVDVFIPNKLSKAGKRFAFVRFIKVFNLDRLVANLCTLWIGSYHLFANHVRFDRPPKSSVPKSDFPPLNGANKAQGTMNNYKANVSAGSFVSVVNGVDNPLISPSPALVLDDGCINECDFSKCTMGRVKDLNSVANLKVVLAEEGFEDVTPFYLGGRWVMFECNTVKVKRNLMNHTGFCSWFHDILEVPQDFVSDERVVWVDIEGIPLYAWKRETFKKIGKKWGETVDIEDSSDSTFGRKRLCIITKHPTSILETFKIIVKGRVFMVRAKELFMWNPLFLDVKERGYTFVPEEVNIHNQPYREDGDFMSFGSSSKISVKVMNNSHVDQKEDSYHSVGPSMGSMIPNKVKILLVAIYAPQDPKYRRLLWDYISIMLSRWNGEVILMGDFNEFVDVKNGRVFFFVYLVTSSGNKLNHRSILLHEVRLDFGPVPFRLYHSWFGLAGFDEMVTQSWNSLSYPDKNALEAMDSMEKSKVKWAMEGDENTKFFHGIINKKRTQLAVRGVFNDGVWLTDPILITQDQVADMEEWFTGMKLKYWNCIGSDFCDAVDHFFVNGSFSKGCNSSFVALIPKVTDAKFVKDYRPISLIGCVYKVVTKIMAKRLAMVINDIVSDTQSAFVANRHILDGPFILNEVLQWCKRKKKKSMFFKVDFAKAYDSVRWDFLIDVLEAFGFGSTWCKWVRGTFCHAKGSILVNGSPSSEFQFQCGLKQGDPLSPFLFILVMESLHLFVCRAVNDRLFTGIRLHDSISLSHLFYADDALFLFIRGMVVAPYANIPVTWWSWWCECMSRSKPWDDVVAKLKARLSKWKAKTLSIGGRLTLLKI
ncbi:RNA-directed DNA polymerase, eukaryota [Tanacetum coccineum]